MSGSPIRLLQRPAMTQSGLEAEPRLWRSTSILVAEAPLVRQGLHHRVDIDRRVPSLYGVKVASRLEMVLDHDSGGMDGRCLKGRFAGRALSSLSHHELLQLLEELRATDAEGAFLMEAYLDRRGGGDATGIQSMPRGMGRGSLAAYAPA
jgi:hypothetical protein